MTEEEWRRSIRLMSLELQHADAVVELGGYL